MHGRQLQPLAVRRFRLRSMAPSCHFKILCCVWLVFMHRRQLQTLALRLFRLRSMVPFEKLTEYAQVACLKLRLHWLGALCRRKVALSQRFRISASCRCTTPEPEPEPQIPKWGADLRETVGGKLGWVPAVGILAGIFWAKHNSLTFFSIWVSKRTQKLSSYIVGPQWLSGKSPWDSSKSTIY